MPRVIDFGAPYGTREFPDETTDEQIVAQYDALKSQEPEPSIGDYAKQAAGSLIRGAFESTATIPEGAAIFNRIAGRISPGGIPSIVFPQTALPLRALAGAGVDVTEPTSKVLEAEGRFLRGAGEVLSPAPVPELRESLLASELPYAVGSFAPFLVGGLAGGAAKVPVWLSAASIGSLSTAKQFYDDAKAKGADESTAEISSLIGNVVGTSEALPVARIVNKINRATRGTFLRGLLDVGIDSFEEAVQNSAQQVAQNFTAQQLYEKDRDLGEGFWKAAGLGGASGFIVSALSSALGAGRARLLRREQPERKRYAGEIRTEITPPGEQAPGLVPGEEGPLRLRNAPPPVPLETQAGATIEEALKPYGVALGDRVTTFSDETPEAPAARTIFDQNNNFQRIELNQAKIATPQQAGQFFEHEVSHVASDSGALAPVFTRLTPEERTTITAEMQQLGYNLGNQNEFDARGTERLVNTWRDRTWFGQLVGRVTAWASENLGLKLSRRAAEAIAVRAVGRAFGQVRTAPAEAVAPTELVRVEAAATEPLVERVKQTAQATDVSRWRIANNRVSNRDYRLPTGLSHGEINAAVAEDRSLAKPLYQALVQLNPELQAISTQRPYRGPFSPQHDIVAGVASKFEPEVIRHFVEDLGGTYQGANEGPPPTQVERAEEAKVLPGGEPQKPPETPSGAPIPEIAKATSLVGRTELRRRAKILLDNGWIGPIPADQPAEGVALVAASQNTVDGRWTPEFERAALRRPERAEEAKVLPPPLDAARVAGASAQLGRVAENIVAQREAAGTQLSGLAYERQQYKTARNELRRLTEMATGRLFQQGLSVEDNPEFFPNPDEGVGIQDGQVVVGEEFLQALNAGGENPNPANTRAMQGEIYFEKEAHRLTNLRTQIDTLTRAKTYFAQLGQEEAELKRVQDMIDKLSAQATKLSEAQWNGKTIGERANEIEAAENERPALLAQRRALGLGPVVEFFGRQVGGYRDFLQKALQGAAVAEALKSETTDPAELKRLTAEAAGWLTLPEDVRDSIASGTSLSDEQRVSAFAALGSAFEDFTIQRQQMTDERDSRLKLINGRVNELTKKIADAKVSEGMAEVLVADVLAALDGETGGTGTLQSQATAQELKGRLTAIRNFALSLGHNLETNGALFDWLTNPTASQPIVNQQMATALGVDAQTLDMILKEVKKNPAFGSAVVTLVNSADKNLAKLPIVQLQQIQDLLNQGETQAANAAASKMIASAKSRASLAASSQRQNLRELEGLDIERQSLEQGVAMFDELAASPDFKALRDAVSNSPFGLLEKMDIGDNRTRTFRAFGAKGLPSHEELRLDASDSPVLKAQDHVRVWKWYRAAQEHLDAYYTAKAAYDADPAKNPSPASLGFDLPEIRGLQDAVNRSVAGSAQELSTQSPGSRWAIPWLVRAMNKLSWFRQHKIVAQMVGGETGTNLRAKQGDWVNHFLISQHIMQKYQDYARLRHAAMKSHPEVQLNTRLYRRLWNEMAHYGRQFGSPVKTGFILPLYGAAVTKEDMALLNLGVDFEEDLRRNVVETHPIYGVRLQKGNRTLVRPGAYVGDKGLPRWSNRDSNSFIAGILNAYGEPAVGFDITSDLSATSSNPVVQFWNGDMNLLFQHVFDSARKDRAMKLAPLMEQAERTAAADWVVNGKPAIQSLDDLATELVKHFPPAPGLNVRQEVVNGLNAELRQYRDAAKRIDTERKEKTDARTSRVKIAFTADNEFTKPAAFLELPSSLYDYGVLSDTDIILVKARANHERVVEYAQAIERALADLNERIEQIRKNPALEKQLAHGGSIQELIQVAGILRQLSEDFNDAYRMGTPEQTRRGFFGRASGLLTSAVLALPVVNLRNMTQGQFEVYAMSRGMGLAGERMLVWRAMANMPKTLIRYALHIGAGLAKRTDLGTAFLTGKNLDVFTRLVDGIAGLLGQSDFRASADRVHELGFDTRDGFLERMRRLWQASAESAQVEELGRTRLLGRRPGKLLGLPTAGLKALFDTIGVQESDLTINAALLTYATDLQKRLEEVAMNYGAERERQGLTAFDPTNRAFDLKPDEWAAFKNQAANAESLGLFRLFLESTVSAEGFQLERSLWNFYQAKKTNPAAKIFTDRQFDAVQRGLISEFNASTPANRSSAAAGNNVIRNLLTLQGYVSDGLLKLMNVSMGGNRDRTAIAGLMAKTPLLAGLALMSILIGWVVGAVTGGWEKWVRGRQSSLPNPVDADFYTSFKRFAEGTARLSFGQLFYIGDIILAVRGEVTGNRGFDPIGRVFPISVAQRALNAFRGMWVTQPQATLADRLQPAADFGRSLLPWATEIERLFSGTMVPQLQAKRVVRGEGENQDLLPERRAQPFTGPSYGPTTIVRRNLEEALGRYWQKQQAGDEAGAAAALDNAKGELKKLEDYYAAKYVKKGSNPEQAAYKAKQDLWRDYQELNPVVAGLLGKRPTKAELDSIRGAISGSRAQAVDEGIAAWQAGGQALFGRTPPVTREEAAASRAGVGGGGGGGFAGIPSQIPAGLAIGGGGGLLGRRRLGGGRPAGLRRIGRRTGPPRLRVSRPGGGGRTGGLRRRAGLPRLGLRRQRLGPPRIRPATSTQRFARISGRNRRLGLGRSRRRRLTA